MEIIFNAHTLLNLNRGELIQVRFFWFFFPLITFNVCKHPACVSACTSVAAVFAKVQWREHLGATW